MATSAKSVDAFRLRSVVPVVRLVALLTLSHIQRRPYWRTGDVNTCR